MLFLSEKDLLLTPMYMAILYIIILLIRKNTIKDPLLKKYFLRGISLKLFGAIALGFIYEFVYHGGDTRTYFLTSIEIDRVFWEDPLRGLKLITFPEITEDATNPLSLFYVPIRDSSSFLVSRICALFGLFSFSTYTTISLFFGFISFYGVWSLFRLLYTHYPAYHKQFAISLLYMPSVFFWGSGIMKDGLCLSALCMAFYALHQYINTKKGKYIAVLIFSIYIMVYIKIYIALCFIPAAFMWLFVRYNNKIRSKILKTILMPLCLVLGIGLGTILAKSIAEKDARYNFDKIAYTAQETAYYIGRISMSQGGSYYSLGEYDATISGMLSKAPAAIWVTLFRPYIWESKNVPMLLSALESFFFLFMTLKLFYLKKWKFIFNSIATNEYLFFSIVFSLTFAFAIGISTYNFGTLVRYKIPLMPFYLSSIYIMLLDDNGFHRKRRKKLTI